MPTMRHKGERFFPFFSFDFDADLATNRCDNKEIVLKISATIENRLAPPIRVSFALKGAACSPRKVGFHSVTNPTPQILQSLFIPKLTIWYYRQAQDEEEDEEEEEEDEEVQPEQPFEDDEDSPSKKKAAEESEAVKRQKELIQMQMLAQQQLIQSAKEAATTDTSSIVTKELSSASMEAKSETGDKVNVLDIKVEDDFDIDDIWINVWSKHH